MKRSVLVLLLVAVAALTASTPAGAHKVRVSDFIVEGDYYVKRSLGGTDGSNGHATKTPDGSPHPDHVYRTIKYYPNKSQPDAIIVVG